jgi:hypothetical protein
MGATEGLTNLLFSYLMSPSRELSNGRRIKFLVNPAIECIEC